jgi:hypothetical protein
MPSLPGNRIMSVHNLFCFSIIYLSFGVELGNLRGTIASDDMTLVCVQLAAVQFSARKGVILTRMA